MDDSALKNLVEEAKASGGSEMANYQLFVERLTGALGVAQPDMAKEETRLNDYVFERAVKFRHTGGTTSTGRIDCYKRDCFILEAKQSAKRKKARATEQLEMAGMEATQKLGHAKRGTKSWDKVMIAAKKQAEDYARALPDEHDYPPFLLIVDVGNVIEVFADFSGQGRNYAHFPDRQGYRLSMDDLLESEVQERLRAIWTDPHSLDPTKISAAVTEDIAKRLAKIAKSLEKRHDPKDIAEFLMRCLFTMFAEDVELIEKSEEEKRTKTGPFENMLKRMIATPDVFPQALETLWKTMDSGGYVGEFGRSLKRFNGTLFKSCKALPLSEDDIRELWLASTKDWRDVEPAIFGTLLERALDTKERGKLGAHFTPRVYVERLVVPTIIEPLREDWEEVQARVEDLQKQGEDDAARQAVKDFHHRLCTTRVLDPACGTGNFLYVSLELMKRLEGEVLEALEALGEDEAKLLLDGETVNPRQFHGLEINPRAVPIADLVLWLGFLKWQLRTVEATSLPEPILHAYGTIREQDAILAYDKQELLRDEAGKPLSVWDGETRTTHAVTGDLVPDREARVEVYEYKNPREAIWPDADFIVGNPPFIGSRRKRRRLGPGYVEALKKAYPKIPASADLVMVWWERSARAKAKHRRFGFVTTNSIKQTFNRRIVQNAITRSRRPISLSFALPDHPWADDEDAAAVRISMTVGVFDEQRAGTLSEIVTERSVPDGLPEVTTRSSVGRINSRLNIGVDIDDCKKLTANRDISHQGMILNGTGFRVERVPSEIRNSSIDYRDVLKSHFAGANFADGRKPLFIFDFFGLSENEVKEKYPHGYQHVYNRVKPFRDEVADQKSKDVWWIFAAPREDLRDLMRRSTRLIATRRSSTHRTFQYVPANLILDDGAVLIGLESSEHLSALSSYIHCFWTIEQAARLGVGNDVRYNKSETFDPFPFPILSDTQSVTLNALGERLDAFRKERLAEHDFLTMTDMYNVLERLRELDAGADVAPLSDKEKDIHEAGLISVLKDIHDEIDREVFAAYGWEDLGERLVGRPGATTPSPHKSEDQEEAEEELLTRLVALNQERAAEEKRGIVRWLRPDYQIPRLGHKVSGEEQLDAELVEAGVIEERSWPKDGLAQIRIVRDVLAEADAPLSPDALAKLFKGRTTQKRKDRVTDVLETLVATGVVRSTGPETAEYYLPR
ncbi:MAG: class I SAM-dependent DNA methyltransferase [Parasphingopyxis sp.]